MKLGNLPARFSKIRIWSSKGQRAPLGRKPVAKRVSRTLACIDEVPRRRWHGAARSISLAKWPRTDFLWYPRGRIGQQVTRMRKESQNLVNCASGSVCERDKRSSVAEPGGDLFIRTRASLILRYFQTTIRLRSISKTVPALVGLSLELDIRVAFAAWLFNFTLCGWGNKPMARSGVGEAVPAG